MVLASLWLADPSWNRRLSSNPEGWRDEASRRLALLQTGATDEMRPLFPTGGAGPAVHSSIFHLLLSTSQIQLVFAVPQRDSETGCGYLGEPGAAGIAVSLVATQQSVVDSRQTNEQTGQTGDKPGRTELRQRDAGPSRLRGHRS